MPVTLHAEGESYETAMAILGRGRPGGGAIRIRYREGRDYGRMEEPGCIVKIEGDIDREFSSCEQALAFVGEFLCRRDAWALLPTEDRHKPSFDEPQWTFLAAYERATRAKPQP